MLVTEWFIHTMYFGVLDIIIKNTSKSHLISDFLFVKKKSKKKKKKNMG